MKSCGFSWRFISSQYLLILVMCSLIIFVESSDKGGNIGNGKKPEPFEVRLYNKVHFEGRYIKLKVGNEKEPCVNLPPVWDKKTASVDPLGCVILYAENDCKGLRRRLERWSWGSSSLKDITFENMISSLSPCPIVRKIIIPGFDDEL